MKFLTLVRHAKSSWDNPEWSDMERPLNNRGIVDAPFMANLISQKSDKPDRIYSSPANRAFSTAIHYAAAFGIKEKDVIVDEGIYNFGKRHILNLAQYLDDSVDSVFFFGHNPDITSLSSYLSGDFFDNVPTCGTVAVQFDIEKWDMLSNNTGKLIFFEYPKLYPKKDRLKYFDELNA